MQDQKQKRDKRLPGRVSEAELLLIDALRDKIQLTKTEKISRVDAILAAIKYADGGMFPINEKP